MNFNQALTRSHLRCTSLLAKRLMLVLLTILPATAGTAMPQDSRGHVMYLTALAGRTSDVEALISEGVPVDWKIENGSTALMAAALGGHAETARFLLESGADPDAKTNSGESPLLIASRWGHTAVQELLIDAGAELNATIFSGVTILHITAQFGPVDAVRLLVGAGANVNARDIYGTTVLEVASHRSENRREVEAILLEAGERAEPDAAAAVRAGVDVPSPKKTKHVNPVYPEDAREAWVTGVVVLEAEIDPGGLVEKLHVLRSIPILDLAAFDAVRQWTYEPTLLDGVAVSVVMTIPISFTLPESGEEWISLGIVPSNRHSLRGWPQEQTLLKLERYSLTFREDGSREYKGTIRNISEKNLNAVNVVVLFRWGPPDDTSQGSPGSELVSIEGIGPDDVRDFSILLQFEPNIVYREVDLLFFHVREMSPD